MINQIEPSIQIIFQNDRTLVTQTACDIFSCIVRNCLNNLFPWSHIGGLYNQKKLQDLPAYTTSIRYYYY